MNQLGKLQILSFRVIFYFQTYRKLIFQSHLMTSNSQNNPFKIETDNKKFFTSLPNIQQLQSIPEYTQFENGLNRIKNMNKELQQLAKKREQMLFKDAHMDFIFKKQKPNLSLNDFITAVPVQGSQKDKKFRVRALLKQKKETVHEFLQKKKQIYISKMNINIKKQETIKLSDYIKDEEQTLKARKLYFDNDVEFMHKFIEGIKKQAEDAQTSVQNQLKVQETLVSKLNSLQAETQKLGNLISKDNQTLNNLKTYKEFIDSFYDEDRKWKPFAKKNSETQEVMFMTENMNGISLKNLQKAQGMELIIRFQPQNLLQIFMNAEENNIREIQNLHDKQDELETIIKEEKQSKQSLDRIVQENESKLDEMMKKYEQKQSESSRLKEMKKNNSISKINILDSENLDIEKISSKIFEISKQIDNKDRRETEQFGQKGLKKAMTIIEQDIQKLHYNIATIKEQYPQLIDQIEKEIKQNQKKENILRKQQQAKQLELKKLKDQQKKKNEPHNEMIKGRKDMKKVLIEKKVKKKREVDVKVDNDEDRYLNEDEMI